MLVFKLKEVTFLVLLGVVFSAAQYQRNPQQIQGEYVGFLSNGRCMKEVNTADLYLVGMSEHQAQRGRRPGTSIIQTCCENFVQDPLDPNRCNAAGTSLSATTCSSVQVLNDQNRCVDICPWGCPNGLCNGATCICNHGYRLDPTGKFCTTGGSTGGLYPTLQPQGTGYCRDGCYNGVCNQYGECTCQPGFQLNPRRNGCDRSANQCRGCYRGTCVGPNQCVCPSGYYLQGDDCASSSSQYQPSTAQCRGCYRGTCVGPNQCVCPSNLVLQGDDCVGSSATYEPTQRQPGYSQCRGCLRGNCVGPNQCQCPTGSLLQGDDCVSTSSTYQPGYGGQTQGQCRPDCLNGQCVGYNQCQCYPGYSKDPVQQHVCVPYCSKGCPNGSCSSPEFCVCNQGYRKMNGVCQRY